MVKEDIIRTRLTLLEGYIDELRALQPTDFQTYEENYLIHRTVERCLHLATETCLDVGQHIIADDGLRPAVDNKDVFNVLGECDILVPDQVGALTNMARFRNLIVHDYARVDNAIVYAILQHHLNDFTAFAESVLAYLARSSDAQNLP